MPKKRIYSSLRDYYKKVYERKYYDIWMNEFRYQELDYQQNEYIMRKLWKEIGVSGFIIDGTKGSSDYPNGVPCFTLFAPAMYNIYDYPTHATLINTRGVKFIPNTLQEIDKDIVIFYSNKLRKGIYFLIEPLLDRLALIECVIKINLNAHKVPFIIPTSPEDRKMFESIWDDLQDDQEAIFIPAENFDKLKVLMTGNQYIIDKLYDLKDKIEGELREFFGFNSLPVNEKKEHLISDEVNSNNEYVDYRYNSLKECMKDNAKRFEAVFGFKLTLVEHELPANENKEEEETQDEI